MSPQLEFTVITNATMINGTGTPPLENTIIVIEDDRIVSVGSEVTTHIPNGAKNIDARGAVAASWNDRRACPRLSTGVHPHPSQG
ncbi:hypothetical protein KAH43_03740 [Candidatus Bipolaricaulota bacterium]|nr:hypothetical protein [Candidatus Bipolaricaulota bacterium]